MDTELAGYSTLIVIFSGMLFLYALLLAVTRDPNLLPRNIAVSIRRKNRKEYIFQLGKVIALTALAPLLSAVVTLLSGNIIAALAVLIVGVAAAIWLGTKIIRKE